MDGLTTILRELEDCAICPRSCHTNRFRNKLGYCRSDASFNIASVCIHRGEEPVISGHKGICNIFFTRCNLQCIYCQNHQISDRRLNSGDHQMTLNSLIREITAILDSGVTHVGFVSPSHHVPHVKVIIKVIESVGYKPVWVYNTNAYDKLSTLKSLDGLIDVYLPDMKYMDRELAGKYSQAEDYPDFATRAISEMYRQKGSALILNEDGVAVSGMIVRHLVLPGHVENSLNVLRFLAWEISPKIHVSLMAQYYPTKKVSNHSMLHRGITAAEYAAVTGEMERLGLDHGWIQELESRDFYQPDFRLDHPFEKE